MFMVESEFAPRYIESEYVKPLEDFGITGEDLSEQFRYTQQVVTNKDGKQVGSAWMATPGCFMYNVAYAKALWAKKGWTYSNANVAEKTASWREFEMLAAEVKSFSGSVDYATLLGADANLPIDLENKTFAAGEMHMLAGKDDLYRLYSCNATMKMYDSAADSITIDPQLWKWVDKTKEYVENDWLCGFDSNYALWQEKWRDEQRINGDAFGTFGCPWYVDFMLASMNQGKDKVMYEYGSTRVNEALSTTRGSWNIVAGPQSFFWGGSWICPTVHGYKNMPDTIKDIILKMTCDGDVVKQITDCYGDFTNHKAKMLECSENNEYVSRFTKQNNFKVYYQNALEVDARYLSKHDQYIYEVFKSAMTEYFMDTNWEYTKSYYMQVFRQRFSEKVFVIGGVRSNIN